MTTTQKTPTAPTKKAPVADLTNEQKFWKYMLEIQKEVAAQDFGSKKGKGGSELKDSHALHHLVRERFIENDVTFDLTPIDVTMIPVGTGFAVFGNYLAKFYFDGELVYETTSFGSFDTGNSAQATHGSYTAARTSLLFNITQASVKSQEDMEQQRQNDINRQPNRQPANPLTGEVLY